VTPALARRLPALAALLGATAIALGAGCGEDEQEAYAEDLRPLNRQIGSLGEYTGTAIEGAEERTDQQIERQFGQIADELRRLRGKLEDLEPPDDLASLQNEVAEAMRAVENALRGIERAAGASDPDAARQSTIELVRSSEDLRGARRKLGRATR
jgi:TolA-binding protein